jgi:hypothetical protein
MKRDLTFLSFLALLILAAGCNPTSKKADPNNPFVELVNGKFMLKGKEFYPVALNYMVSLQANENEMWPSSYTGYNIGFKNKFTSRDSCLMQLRADMKLIKEMGFNTVRIVSIGEETINKYTGELKIGAFNANELVYYSFKEEKNYLKYFDALKELFSIINESGLKIIFLTRMSIDSKSTETHLSRMADCFKNDSTIMAYDIFNEPLYFDTLERDKSVIYETVKRWNGILKEKAPKQLSTIGLEGIREVFEWDPNILDLDFLTLHPYEYEREQVRNEIYWYGKYIKKPWMIGETAIPADNDSISYNEQKAFAKKTIKQTYDCGGIGYAWWQYKDVEWYSYHANFMGVVSLKGETRTSNGDLVFGTVKPVASVFKSFDPATKKDTCRCLTNYYNYSNHKACRITGFLMNEDNDPIEGGVILGWNQGWTHSYHTISRKDGSFELLGDFIFHHWMASATEFTMIRGDINPDTLKRTGVTTINIGEIKIKELPFLD